MKSIKTFRFSEVFVAAALFTYSPPGGSGKLPKNIYTVKVDFTTDVLGGGQLNLYYLVGASRHYTTRVKIYYARPALCTAGSRKEQRYELYRFGQAPTVFYR